MTITPRGRTYFVVVVVTATLSLALACSAVAPSSESGRAVALAYERSYVTAAFLQPGNLAAMSRPLPRGSSLISPTSWVNDDCASHRGLLEAVPKQTSFHRASAGRRQQHQTRNNAVLNAVAPRPPNSDALDTDTEIETDDEVDGGEVSEGSVLGAALLFAGTAVGAGMLALPAETAPAGFTPSLSALVLCWAFTFVTSLVTLEASWMADRKMLKAAVEGEEVDAGGGGGGGFLSIGRTALGPVGEVATALLFWFLLTSIIIAYTSEGGSILSDLASEQFGVSLDARAGSAAFMGLFASLAIFGTERVDLVNRFLVAGLVGSFLGLVAVGLPMIEPDLLSRADWSAVYPPVISVGILSFGAQNVVPTLLKYLGGDAERTRRAVLIGSLIPLVMYGFWEVVFLGVVPWDPDASGGSKMEVVTALGATGGAGVRELVEAFSACSIGSSMAGASVSLVDFFQDVIASKFNKQAEQPFSESKWGMGARVGAAAVALGPPLGLACAYPDAFLGALENAGLIGGVSLYGILPALAVVKQRTNAENAADGSETMPGRLLGGMAALYLIAGVSIALVVPEFVRLAGGSLT